MDPVEAFLRSVERGNSRGSSRGSQAFQRPPPQFVPQLYQTNPCNAGSDHFPRRSLGESTLPSITDAGYEFRREAEVPLDAFGEHCGIKCFMKALVDLLIRSGAARPSILRTSAASRETTSELESPKPGRHHSGVFWVLTKRAAGWRYPREFLYEVKSYLSSNAANTNGKLNFHSGARLIDLD